MAEKEIIIAKLRKKVKELDKVSANINEMRENLLELISELEDESKLGTPPHYDFGSGKLKKAKRDLYRNIKRDIKKIKEAANETTEHQKKTSKKIKSDVDKFEKE